MITYESRQAARRYLNEKQWAKEIKQLSVLIVAAGCFAIGILIGLII